MQVCLTFLSLAKQRGRSHTRSTWFWPRKFEQVDRAEDMRFSAAGCKYLLNISVSGQCPCYLSVRTRYITAGPPPELWYVYWKPPVARMGR